MANVKLEWLVRRDLEAVLDIERASFLHPYTEAELREYLTQRNCIGMAAKDAGGTGPVVGFMVYELHKRHLEIIDLAVLPDARRQGIGRQMLQMIVGKLTLERRHSAYLMVSEYNVQAQVWLRECGWRCIGTVSEPYDHCDWDGLRFGVSVRSGVCAE